eukprot:m.191063 g.191063  ORF g.191063 m.191063 type:complete len:450 (-) comp14833_c0_seq1:424-1773(-)
MTESKGGVAVLATTALVIVLVAARLPEVAGQQKGFVGVSGKQLMLQPPEGGSVVVDGIDYVADRNALLASLSTALSTNEELLVQVSILTSAHAQLRAQVQVIATEPPVETISNVSASWVCGHFQPAATSVRHVPSGFAQATLLAQDSTRLVTATSANETLIWDITDIDLAPRLLQTLKHNSTPLALAMTHGGTVLHVGLFNGSVEAWNVTSRPATFLTSTQLHSNAVTAFITPAEAFTPLLGASPNGPSHIFTASFDRTIRIWNTTQAKAFEPELIASFHSPEGAVSTLAFAEPSQRLYSGTVNYTINVWDVSQLSQPRLITTLHKHDGVVTSLIVNDDVTRLYSSGSFDGTILVWDIVPSVPVLIHTLRDHASSAYVMALAPSNRWLYAGGDRQVAVWDLTLSPPELIRTLQDQQGTVHTMALDDQAHRLFSTSTGRTIHTYPTNCFP